MLPAAVTHGTSGRIGLALAGGAPEGALYEIGALRALEESLEGIDFNNLVIYVGVSAGAIIGACLANGMSPTGLCRAMGRPDPAEHLFRRQDPGEPPPRKQDSGEHAFSRIFFTPAVHEYLGRGRMTPHLVGSVLWNWLWPATDGSFMEAVVRLSEALPAGVFDNEPIRKFLENVFSIEGRTDDFRRLGRPLVVVATDLESAQARRFGEPGSDHVPISKAVQASSALPGLYMPVPIEGRYYVDGILLKTMHASVALEAGAGLVISINPLVPIDMNVSAASNDVLPSSQPMELGLPMVLSQALRTLIRSRLSVGMAAYGSRYPDRDVVLFEATPGDYRMFFSNPLSFSSRRAVCEHAYQVTRRDLLDRFDALAPIFARHGLRLRRDVLEDPSRDLWSGVGLVERRSAYAGENLDRALTRLEAFVASQ